MKKTIFYLIITLAFFGMLITIEYATDTYSVFNFNEGQIYAQYANSGRFVTAIIGKVVKMIGVPENIIYTGSYFLAIILVVLSEIKLYKIIDVKNNILKLLIPTVIIINPFSIELFLFIEKGIMAFAIFMCVYAVSYTKKYLETNKIKNVLISFLFMFVANCSYQGVVGIYVAIMLIFILKYSDNSKQFVKNNLAVGFIYGISAVFNIMLVRINYKTNRLSGDIHILQSLQKIFAGSLDMIKTYRILPKYLFILAILFTFLCFWCKIWKERKKSLHIAKFIYIILGVTLVAVIPQLMQPTTSIWLVPRSTYCFASLYGILLLYLNLNFDFKTIGKIALVAVTIMFLLIQLVKFIKIERDRYTLNKEDLKIANYIVQQIKQYENKTGNKVEYIEIYQDLNPQYTYSGIFATGDMNVKCFSSDWSTESILEYYLKRDLKIANVNKERVNKDWNKFDFEQIQFKDNTLILVNY